jgi:dihydroneopterin aldolase
MNKILINGLECWSLIGVYDWEREEKQALLVDISLTIDLSIAAQSDNVDDTINYASLAEHIEKIALTSGYQLLEALAQRMMSFLFDEYKPQAAVVRITKPNILANAKSVTVELSRNI